MVARQFQVRHNDSDFLVDHDTDDGLRVFQLQLFSLTSILPEEQKIFSVDDDRVVSDNSDLISISEKLRLVSINDEVREQQGNESKVNSVQAESSMFDKAEKEALLSQQYVVTEDNGEFEKKIRSYVDQVRMYEDPVRQEAARKTVPVEELEEKVLVSLAKEGNFKPSKIEQDHAFLLQLLSWFKQSFSGMGLHIKRVAKSCQGNFEGVIVSSKAVVDDHSFFLSEWRAHAFQHKANQWVDTPPCDGCGSKTTSHSMGSPLSSEIQYGASRVELYPCAICSRITRFPRYKDPIKLLETRRGRCGEWANCFTLYCRAFGYVSRLILSFTDHAWTECFSQVLGRWMHLDPCETVYDRPLLYEQGWGTKVNYTIAIAKDGVYDVTKRYTRKWHEVLSRRNIMTESSLSAVVTSITQECRSGFTSLMLSELHDRDKKEKEELERYLYSPDDASISLLGKQSGDKEWRKLRQEIGSDSQSCSACPVRICVDEHVTRCYNAFLPVLSHFVKEEDAKAKAIKALKIFKGIITDVKNSPFRMRKAFIDSDFNSKVHQLLPHFAEFLDALSLKSTVDPDGKVSICLAGDPVKTSLALPVMLDALDDMVHNLNKCDNFGEDSLTFPLVKLTRMHSGSVLASGEEYPFGIVTSAFDGIHTSKWEEPNGAKGCWIMYKVEDNRMHELLAYELMSANDAPERDPMDWVVEGSDDGGSSWHLLDKQTCQIFEDRFQRRAFKVTSTGLPFDVLRFRFLAVRDVKSTSRLQIGSIDLYEQSN